MFPLLVIHFFVKERDRWKQFLLYINLNNKETNYFKQQYNKICSMNTYEY